MAVNETVYYNMLQPAPIVYVNVLQPRRGKAEYKLRYEATYLLEPNGLDHVNIYNLVMGVAQAAGIQNPLHIPLQDGNDPKKKGEFFRGKIAFTAHSNAEDKDGNKRPPPRLFMVTPGKIVPLTEAEAQLNAKYFYPGVRAGGNFGFRAYDGKITAYLNELYSFGDGERIADRGGDPTASNESLLKYAGHSSDLNPLAGMQQSAVAPSAAPREQY